MSDNKNNNLIEDIEKIEKRRKPRKHQSKKSDMKIDHNLSKGGERKRSIEEILDKIGATNGTTFISNGERDGSNSVPESEFANAIRNIIRSSEEDLRKKESEKDNNTSSTFSDMLSGLFEEPSFAGNFEGDYDDEEDDFEDEDEDGDEDSVDSVFRLVLGGEGVEMCPPVESILKYLTQTRPFGIEWEMDKVIKFLRDNGYTIYKKKNSGGEFMVAYKKGKTDSAEKIGKNNLGEEFSSVIQDILLGWLNKIK